MTTAKTFCPAPFSFRITPFFFVCTFICSVLFFSCAKSTPQNQDANDKLFVMASFYMMADFAQKIGGDLITMRTLIPAGQEAHDWEPSPGDIAALESAAVFIYNGAGFEPWVQDVLASVSAKNLIVIDASSGIELIDADPHVWLSPVCAKQQFKNIAAGLTRAAPEHAEEFARSLDIYTLRCDELHHEYSAALSVLPSRKFITVHAAFGYLAREYALEQIGASGAGDEPGPLVMRNIIEYAKTNDIGTVFYEEAANKKTAQTIAREIKGEAVFLHPLEGLSREEARAGDDYFSVMRKNLSVLQKAFAKSEPQ